MFNRGKTLVELAKAKTQVEQSSDKGKSSETLKTDDTNFCFRKYETATFFNTKDCMSLTTNYDDFLILPLCRNYDKSQTSQLEKVEEEHSNSIEDDASYKFSSNSDSETQLAEFSELSEIAEPIFENEEEPCSNSSEDDASYKFSSNSDSETQLAEFSELSEIAESAPHSRLRSEIKRSKIVSKAHATVLPSKGKRHSKRTACPFCKKEITQFPRHLTLKHKLEPSVAKLLDLPVRSKERNRIIMLLRGRGNFQHNTEALQNKCGHIIVKKQPAINIDKPEKYVPCTKCLAFFSKKFLFKHIRNCKGREGIANIRAGSAFLPISDAANLAMRKNVLPGMANDTAYTHIINDDLILKFGSFLSDKHTEQHLINHIRSKLRLVGRLVLKIREENCTINSLAELLNPRHVDIVINGINKIAGLKGNIYEKPSIPSTLYTAILSCVNLATIESIKLNNTGLQMQINNFSIVFKTNAKIFLKRSTRSSSEKKWNKPTNLPLTKDIKMLSKFLLRKEDEYYNLLKMKYAFSTWDFLSKILLIRIMLFNRKRPGEIERLELQHYNRKQQITEESTFYNTLKPLEKAISKNYWRIEFRGKLHRGVPILINNRQVKIIKILQKYKTISGVADNNPFVFGRKQNKFLLAGKNLKVFSEECGAKKPRLLRATLLRKQMATYTQLLSLSGNEIEQVSSFMGHHVDIHLSHYRQNSDVVQIAKISKLLLALEQGRIEEFRGLNLDEMSLEEFNDAEDTQIPSVSQNSPESSTSAGSSTQPSDMSDTKTVTPAKSIDAIGRSSIFQTTPHSMTCHSTESFIATHEKIVTPSKSNKIDERYLRPKKKLIFSQEVVTAKDFSESEEDYVEPSISSTSSSDEDSGEKEKHNQRGKKTSWSTPEKNAIRRHFGHYLLGGELPSADECRNILTVEKVLKNRSVKMMKAWINNQQRLAKKSTLSIKRFSWTTPVKYIVRREFSRYLLGNKLPTLPECEKLRTKYKELEGRTAETIKAWVNNQKKKK